MLVYFLLFLCGLILTVGFSLQDLLYFLVFFLMHQIFNRKSRLLLVCMVKSQCQKFLTLLNCLVQFFFLYSFTLAIQWIDKSGASKVFSFPNMFLWIFIKRKLEWFGDIRRLIIPFCFGLLHVIVPRFGLNYELQISFLKCIMVCGASFKFFKCLFYILLKRLVLECMVSFDGVVVKVFENFL